MVSLKKWNLKKKIITVVVFVIVISGVTISALWYHTSRMLTATYLKSLSGSAMRDAYNDVEYLLKDTSYMATLTATNRDYIIEPAEEIVANPAWNTQHLQSTRLIRSYIRSLNGYKYYIAGISVFVGDHDFITTSDILGNRDQLLRQIREMDQNKLKRQMDMLTPVHLEGFKYTVSSDYVIPAVQGILNDQDQIIGYVVVYFDYSTLSDLFAKNLPAGSYFQASNEDHELIYSNSGKKYINFRSQFKKNYEVNEFKADDVGWTLSMAIPSKYYTNGIRRTTTLSLLLICGILLGAVIISSVVISKITRQITILNNQMKKVSDGNLDVRYEVVSRDEIGEMGATFNAMVSSIKTLIAKVSREEKEKRKKEIAFLQAQINPHFISNVLNTISWMAKMQQANNLIPIIHALNAMLQNVMHQEYNMNPLRDELEVLDNYITLIQYSGTYDFDVEKDIDESVMDLYIPRFILQPIVENAIYHGLPTDISQRGILKISAKAEGQILSLTIEDNGKGMSEEELRNIFRKKEKERYRFNGIGIVNVNERIKLFFGEDYGIRFESEVGHYTKCIYRLPVCNHDITADDEEERPDGPAVEG